MSSMQALLFVVRWAGLGPGKERRQGAPGARQLGFNLLNADARLLSLLLTRGSLQTRGTFGRRRSSDKTAVQALYEVLRIASTACRMEATMRRLQTTVPIHSIPGKSPPAPPPAACMLQKAQKTFYYGSRTCKAPNICTATCEHCATKQGCFYSV